MPSPTRPESHDRRCIHLRIAEITVAVAARDADLVLRADETTARFLVPAADPGVTVTAGWGDPGGADRSGRGLLFVGQSGAGKTTIVRLWEAFTDTKILSDDRIILRRVGGRLTMYGTPWHGEVALVEPASAPLTGVFFLEHGAAGLADGGRGLPRHARRCGGQKRACQPAQPRSGGGQLHRPRLE